MKLIHSLSSGHNTKKSGKESHAWRKNEPDDLQDTALGLTMIHTYNRWLPFIVIAIIAGGIAAIAWTVYAEDQNLRQELLTKSRLVEEGIDPGQVKGLTGTGADLFSPDYLALKEELIRVKAVDPLIRFIYLMGMRPDGNVIFLVDSEPPDTDDYSPPGQVFSEVSPVVLNSLLSDRKESTIGPFSDRWGTWMSSIIPVVDPATGSPVAIFGMDVDARDWYIGIAKACLPVLIGTLILLLLLLGFTYISLRNEEEKLMLAHSEKAARLSELRLKQSEERLRLLVKNVNDGIIVHTLPKEGLWRILEVNDRAGQIFGYTSEELLEISFSDLMEPGEWDRIRGLSGDFLEKGHAIYETQCRKKEGQDLPIEISARLFEMEGEPTVLAVIRDVKERKMLQKEMESHTIELTRYSNALRETNDKLNLMNSITRHDINNQLTVLIGHLEMMKEKYQDPAIQQYLEIERRAAKNIERQIMFTREYQDIGSQAPRWFDLRSVIFRAQEAVPLASISLTVRCERIEIYADPLFERVFYTLFENTIRHGGPVTRIGISCHERNNGLRILYEDDGEGVLAAHKEDIFEREYFKHTGYGLFLSASILQITGISIKETGVPGKGARFEVLVPKGAYRFTTLG